MVHVRTARLTQSDGARLFLTTNPSATAESKWYVEDVAGWYGGSGVRGDSTGRLGHGNFVGRGYREGRTLTLNGWVTCADTDIRDWQERNLSGLMWDGDWGDLTCDDGNATLSTRVRLDGSPQVVKIGLTSLQFQIPLVSESPFLFGDWRETLIKPVGAGVGMEFPLFGSGVLSYGSAVDTSEWIWNDGNADSWPQFEVYSDSPSGFYVSLGGRRVTYPWATFLEVPILVDMAGAMMVGGQDQSHMLGERDWAAVPPKSIESPSFGLLSGGTGWATVRHRDTYA